MLYRLLPGLLLLVGCLTSPICHDLLAADETPIEFDKHVRPILERHCWACHGADKQQAGLRLDVRERAVKGGESGEPAIVPGEPEKSLAVLLIRGDDPDVVMPPEGERVSEAELQTPIQWIEQGAPWSKKATKP